MEILCLNFTPRHIQPTVVCIKKTTIRTCGNETNIFCVKILYTQYFKEANNQLKFYISLSQFKFH